MEDVSRFLSTDKQYIKKGVKPVLRQLLTSDMIQLQQKANDWKEAIRLAANPLLETGAILSEYIDAMIQNVLELGPYVVLAPKIAIPHARPEQGVKKMGMSLLTLQEGVLFENNDTPVELMIVLAAEDKESHLKALAQLSELLSNEEDVQAIMQANKKETVTQLIDKYSNQ
jgi:mannitol/fructose-specific phosphotransferase system IIA component (Ntr-type)